MSDEINLILTKLKLVSESEESCAYICDKEHSKILYDYITNLQDKYERMKENAEILSNGYNDLEKRNEKAIECIKILGIDKDTPDEDLLIRQVLKQLLNILQGEDKK